MRLFIAEDDIQLSTLLRRVAEKEGWSVTTVMNGRELLTELGTEAEPALLVIDIQMPKMDGIEVIENLVGIERRIRIRFMTGGPDSSALAANMIANARDLEVGRFLMKPIHVDAFRAVLKEEAAFLSDKG
ncbi:Response regulator receiver protein CpdR [Roseibaca ekhonensis]|uniref:Response regulator receiver protein CpdR n=1 Tax=Roseinatronobacter ekhonensis TaxID=254356 RepID=A0A3B0MEM4_9RHOB|nr:response regulator [Roseibaca ekhonensis]SUZ34043.1 Response regulator receiver protein CpdR [Roseibaca ekhonensis]